MAKDMFIKSPLEIGLDAFTNEEEEENVDLLQDRTGTGQPFDEDVDLYDSAAFVSSELEIDPGAYLLSSSTYSPVTNMTDMKRHTDLGKSFLAGLTLNNYDYQPDDFLSAEGMAWLGGSVLPFLGMYWSGANIGGRMISIMNQGKKAASVAGKLPGRGGVVPSYGGTARPGSPIPIAGRTALPEGSEAVNFARATEFENTWASLVPQATIEAGLWTGIDPTMEGPEGFATAMMWTTLGQAATTGLGQWIKRADGTDVVTKPEKRVDMSGKGETTSMGNLAEGVGVIDDWKSYKASNNSGTAKSLIEFNDNNKLIKAETDKIASTNNVISDTVNNTLTSVLQGTDSIITKLSTGSFNIFKPGSKKMIHQSDIVNLADKNVYQTGKNILELRNTTSKSGTTLTYVGADDIASVGKYDREKNRVFISKDKVEEAFKQKVWKEAEGYKEKDYPPEMLQDNAFKTVEEFEDFVVIHELTHAQVKKAANESVSAYEARVNNIAYNNSLGAELKTKTIKEKASQIGLSEEVLLGTKLDKGRLAYLSKFNLDDWNLRMEEIVDKAYARLQSNKGYMIKEINSPTQFVDDMTPIDEMLLSELNLGGNFFDETGKLTEFLQLLNKGKAKLLDKLQTKPIKGGNKKWLDILKPKTELAISEFGDTAVKDLITGLSKENLSVEDMFNLLKGVDGPLEKLSRELFGISYKQALNPFVSRVPYHLDDFIRLDGKLAGDTVTIDVTRAALIKAGFMDDAGNFIQKKSRTLQVIRDSKDTLKPYKGTTYKAREYSAKVATFKTGKYKGRTIEDVYQKDIKKSGKGQPPKDTSLNLQAEYTALWKEWFKQNPAKFNAIKQEIEAGTILNDIFKGEGRVNQGDTIMDIIAPNNKGAIVHAPTGMTRGDLDKLMPTQKISNVLDTGIGSKELRPTLLSNYQLNALGMQADFLVRYGPDDISYALKYMPRTIEQLSPDIGQHIAGITKVYIKAIPINNTQLHKRIERKVTKDPDFFTFIDYLVRGPQVVNKTTSTIGLLGTDALNGVERGIAIRNLVANQDINGLYKQFFKTREDLKLADDILAYKFRDEVTSTFTRTFRDAHHAEIVKFMSKPSIIKQFKELRGREPRLNNVGIFEDLQYIKQHYPKIATYDETGQLAYRGKDITTELGMKAFLTTQHALSKENILHVIADAHIKIRMQASKALGKTLLPPTKGKTMATTGTDFITDIKTDFKDKGKFLPAGTGRAIADSFSQANVAYMKGIQILVDSGVLTPVAGMNASRDLLRASPEMLKIIPRTEAKTGDGIDILLTQFIKQYEDPAMILPKGSDRPYTWYKKEYESLTGDGRGIGTFTPTELTDEVLSLRKDYRRPQTPGGKTFLEELYGPKHFEFTRADKLKVSELEHSLNQLTSRTSMDDLLKEVQALEGVTLREGFKDLTTEQLSRGITYLGDVDIPVNVIRGKEYRTSLVYVTEGTRNHNVFGDIIPPVILVSRFADDISQKTIEMGYKQYIRNLGKTVDDNSKFVKDAIQTKLKKQTSPGTTRKETTEYAFSLDSGIPKSKTSKSKIGHIKLYNFWQRTVKNIFDDTGIVNKKLTEIGDIPELASQQAPLTQEFFGIILERLNRDLGRGVQGGLDGNWMLKLLKDELFKALKSRGFKDIDDLPSAPLTNEQKIQANKIRDAFETAGEASKIGANPDAKSIANKKKMFKQVADSMDADLKPLTNELNKSYSIIESALKRNAQLNAELGILDAGNKQSFDKSMEVIEGIRAQMTNEVGSTQNYIKELKKTAIELNQINKLHTKGKALQREFKTKFVTRHNDMINEVRERAAAFKEINVSPLDNMGTMVTMDTLKLPAIRAEIFSRLQQILTRSRDTFLRDFGTPETNFKTLMSQTQGMSDDAIKAHENQIYEMFNQHILNNLDDAMKVIENNGLVNTYVEDMFMLHRASNGDHKTFATWKASVDNKLSDSNLKLEKILRRQLDPQDSPAQSIESADLTGPVTKGADDMQGGGMGGAGTDDPSKSFFDKITPRWIQRKIYSDPEREARIIYDRDGDAVVLELVDSALRGENQLSRFFSRSTQADLTQPNFYRIFEENYGVQLKKSLEDVGQEVTEQRIRTLNEHWYNIDNLSQGATNEAHSQWIKDIIKEKMWIPKSDKNPTGLKYSEWFDRYMKPESEFYNQTYMNKYLAMWDRAAIRETQVVYDELARLRYIGKPETLWMADTLDSLYKTSKQVKETMLHTGIDKANETGRRIMHKIGVKWKDIPYPKERAGFRPRMPDGVVRVAFSLRDVNNKIIKMKPQLFNSHREAAEYIATISDDLKGQLKRDSSKIHVQQADPMTRTLDDINLYNNLDETAEVTLKDIDDYLGEVAGGMNTVRHAEDLIPYISKHSMHRKINAGNLQPQGSIDYTMGLYAYRMAKEGAFKNTEVVGKYVRDKLVQQGYKEDADYIVRWYNNLLGRRGSVETELNKAMDSMFRVAQEIPGVNYAFDKMGMTPGTANFRGLVNFMTNTTSFVALGFNPVTALLQLSILGLNVMPLFGRRSFKLFTDAYKKVKDVPTKGQQEGIYKEYKYIFDELGLTVNKFEGTVSDVLTNAKDFTHSMNAGSLSGMKVKRTKGQTFKDGVKWFRDLSMVMFNAGDRYPRMLTAIMARDNADSIIQNIMKSRDRAMAVGKNFDDAPEAFLKSPERIMYRRIRQAGLQDAIKKGTITSNPKLNQLKNDFAVEFVNRTNHTYNSSNVPEAFNWTALRPFLQFKTWVQKQSMFMVRELAERPKELGAGAYYDMMKIMGVSTVMGGVFSIPFTQDLDKLAQLNFGVSLKTMMYEKDSPLADMFIGGLPSGLGVSLEGRMGTGELQSMMNGPGSIFGIYGNRIIKAIQAYKDGNERLAFNHLAPRFLQNIKQGIEIADTGKLHASWDNQVVLDYEAMGMNPMMMAITKMLGFESIPEGKARAYKHLLASMSKLTKKDITRAYNEIFEYLDDDKGSAEAKEIAAAHNIPWSKVLQQYKKKRTPSHESAKPPYYTYSEEMQRIMETRDKQLKRR